MTNELLFLFTFNVEYLASFVFMNKVVAFFYLLAIVFLVLISSCSSPENNSARSATESVNEPVTGKILYKKNCSVCHGPDGKKGLAGAKDLTVSLLTKEEQQSIIQSGKNGMPGMSSVMNNGEIKMVVEHIQLLKINR